jgi:hypothetical protein
MILRMKNCRTTAFPIVSFGFHTLREEHDLQSFENEVLAKYLDL